MAYKELTEEMINAGINTMSADEFWAMWDDAFLRLRYPDVGTLNYYELPITVEQLYKMFADRYRAENDGE